MKKTIAVMLALLLVGAVSLAEERLNIVATDFVCYDFARQVAGDRAEVTLLIKPGTEVHAYEPTPAEILKIDQADLFIFIGGESDAWVDNVLSGLDADGAPVQLRMMDAVALLEEEGGEDEAHEAHGEGPEYDEHIWTSPVNAEKMVRAAADALAAVDGTNAEVYQRNADAYIAQIDALDAEIRGLVENADHHTLVFADRFPFLYFVREYGLDYEAAFPSCTMDTEPTPQTIMRLIQTVAMDRIPTVYAIEMSTRSVANTIAEETGVAIAELHSMQTVTQAEFENGETYVSIMTRNIDALKEGLYDAR